MRVLLLHPEDPFPRLSSAYWWDLIVDLGRAPASTYHNWSHQAQCRVISIYDFAKEIDDLHLLRQLLQPGMGHMMDIWGIDWWDVLSLEIASDLLQFMLIGRLAKDLGADCKLWSTRAHPLAVALQKSLHAPLTISENFFKSTLSRLHHCYDALARLDPISLTQVIQDKFDAQYAIRRHLTARDRSSGRPVILLPTAYINGSRTALAYAAQLRDYEFMLVTTRSSASPVSVPTNVHVISLSSYFASTAKTEIACLVESWSSLRKQLVASAEPFALAAAAVLSRVPALLRWGIALRDAWNQVFESENVAGCFCTDDSNPPTRIPLILAKNRGLPALACHHGALDYGMAIKSHRADFYLAKSEMEQDYLSRICEVKNEKIIAAAPGSPKQVSPRPKTDHSDRPWLVFFTEPYATTGWRVDEVYRDLLPRLCSLAQTCGLKLVFKLHPFESVRGHRRMLRLHLGEQERRIDVIVGPPSDQLWRNIRFALTVQSSVALECTALGIPVFLCAWLRDAYSVYVGQYTRFGVGRILRSPEQIGEIPRLLQTQAGRSPLQHSPWTTSNRERLVDAFSGNYSLTAASGA